jgi:RNA polymerase sigma-70 factor, ECF subfamily
LPAKAILTRRHIFRKMSKSPNKQMYDPSKWVEEHGDALYRFAILRVKDPSIAEDLVQETFLAALRGIGGFKGGSSLRTWLVGILKHKIIDQFRRNKPEILASDLAITEDESEADRLDRSDARRHGHPVWHDDPDNLLQNKEFWSVLMACLDGLPEAHRRVFSLREIDGIKGDEICKILDITATNLWVMLHRARGKLQNCLENNWFSAR